MSPFAAIAAPTVLSGDFGRHDFHERAPSLEVHLLGEFCVLVDGAAVRDWPGGRARGLLQRLALDPWRAVPRDRLMAEFWPQRDPLAARNNLNVALHGLRRTLAAHAPGFAFIEHRRGCYGLNLAARLWTDVQAFESALAEAREAAARADPAAQALALQSALDLYAGALLAEHCYDDWCAGRRGELHAACVRAAGQLTEWHWQRGDVDACAATAQRLLQLEACDESAHRLLMRCHVRRDHVHLAVRQYHACVETLQRELRLIPSPQTVALYREIRSRQAA